MWNYTPLYPSCHTLIANLNRLGELREIVLCSHISKIVHTRLDFRGWNVLYKAVATLQDQVQ
jgi:hypothetical protein